MSNPTTKVAIIGAGVVGQTFAKLLAECPQYSVVLGSRNGAMSIEAAAKNAHIVLLTVSDSAIQTVCQALVAANAIKADAVVAHCSGALTSEILQSPLVGHRGPIASMHPLQTFPNVEAALSKVAGTYCYCEGDDKALAALAPLITALQMQLVEIQAKNKPLYHAAAVMACNNLSALMEAALQLGEAADIERDVMWKSLKPLVDSTLENIDQQGPAKALTGPVARGDVDTVKSHIQAMQTSDAVSGDLERSYNALGLVALQLAGHKTEPSQQQRQVAEAIKKLLS